MIRLTRLSGDVFSINPDMIERIQSNPDTTLFMAEGNTYLVSESTETVTDLIIDFRASVIARARTIRSNGDRIGIVRSPHTDKE